MTTGPTVQWSWSGHLSRLGSVVCELFHCHVKRRGMAKKKTTMIEKQWTDLLAHYSLPPLLFKWEWDSHGQYFPVVEFGTFPQAPKYLWLSLCSKKMFWSPGFLSPKVKQQNQVEKLSNGRVVSHCAFGCFSMGKVSCMLKTDILKKIILPRFPPFVYIQAVALSSRIQEQLSSMATWIVSTGLNPLPDTVIFNLLLPRTHLGLWACDLLLMFLSPHVCGLQ